MIHLEVHNDLPQKKLFIQAHKTLHVSRDLPPPPASQYQDDQKHKAQIHVGHGVWSKSDLSEKFYKCFDGLKSAVLKISSNLS
jgi:hypothetical protein